MDRMPRLDAIDFFVTVRVLRRVIREGDSGWASAAQQPSFRGRSGGQHRQRDENDACDRESD
jgi:hypothetical protein